METFIYSDLKKACLNKDYTRVKTFGPYAFVLGKIIETGYFDILEEDE